MAEDSVEYPFRPRHLPLKDSFLGLWYLPLEEIESGDDFGLFYMAGSIGKNNWFSVDDHRISRIDMTLFGEDVIGFSQKYGLHPQKNEEDEEVVTYSGRSTIETSIYHGEWEKDSKTGLFTLNAQKRAVNIENQVEDIYSQCLSREISGREHVENFSRRMLMLYPEIMGSILGES